LANAGFDPANLTRAKGKPNVNAAMKITTPSEIRQSEFARAQVARSVESVKPDYGIDIRDSMGKVIAKNVKQSGGSFGFAPKGKNLTLNQLIIGSSGNVLGSITGKSPGSAFTILEPQKFDVTLSGKKRTFKTKESAEKFLGRTAKEIQGPQRDLPSFVKNAFFTLDPFVGPKDERFTGLVGKDFFAKDQFVKREETLGVPPTTTWLSTQLNRLAERADVLTEQFGKYNPLLKVQAGGPLAAAKLGISVTGGLYNIIGLINPEKALTGKNTSPLSVNIPSSIENDYLEAQFEGVGKAYSTGDPQELLKGSAKAEAAAKAYYEKHGIILSAYEAVLAGWGIPFSKLSPIKVVSAATEGVSIAPIIIKGGYGKFAKPIGSIFDGKISRGALNLQQGTIDVVATTSKQKLRGVKLAADSSQESQFFTSTVDFIKAIKNISPISIPRAEAILDIVHIVQRQKPKDIEIVKEIEEGKTIFDEKIITPLETPSFWETFKKQQKRLFNPLGPYEGSLSQHFFLDKDLVRLSADFDFTKKNFVYALLSARQTVKDVMKAKRLRTKLPNVKSLISGEIDDLQFHHIAKGKDVDEAGIILTKREHVGITALQGQLGNIKMPKGYEVVLDLFGERFKSLDLGHAQKITNYLAEPANKLAVKNILEQAAGQVNIKAFGKGKPFKPRYLKNTIGITLDPKISASLLQDLSREFKAVINWKNRAAHIDTYEGGKKVEKTGEFRNPQEKETIKGLGDVPTAIVGDTLFGYKIPKQVYKTEKGKTFGSIRQLLKKGESVFSIQDVKGMKELAPVGFRFEKDVADFYSLGLQSYRNLLKTKSTSQDVKSLKTALDKYKGLWGFDIDKYLKENQVGDVAQGSYGKSTIEKGIGSISNILSPSNISRSSPVIGSSTNIFKPTKENKQTQPKQIKINFDLLDRKASSLSSTSKSRISITSKYSKPSLLSTSISKQKSPSASILSSSLNFKSPPTRSTLTKSPNFKSPSFKSPLIKSPITSPPFKSPPVKSPPVRSPPYSPPFSPPRSPPFKSPPYAPPRFTATVTVPPVKFPRGGFFLLPEFKQVKRQRLPGQAKRKVFVADIADPMRAGVFAPKGVKKLISSSPKIFKQIDVNLAKSRRSKKAFDPLTGFKIAKSGRYVYTKKNQLGSWSNFKI